MKTLSACIKLNKAEQTFLEEQHKMRLSRALHSGYRKTQLFQPGELVFYWRNQVPKSQGSNHHFKKGKFLGPARVLATETKLNGSEWAPGSCVWLFRGDRLIKAAPQQLRHASYREAALEELTSKPQPIPWTISSLLETSERKAFDDITQDWSQEELDQETPEMDESENMEVEAQAKTGKRKESEPPRQQWEPPTHRLRQRTPGVPKQPPPPDDALILLAAEEPSAHLATADACLEIGIDLPEGKAAMKKSWIRDFDAFLANQVKKNHIEVSERHLSPEEKQQFQGAKDVEIKNFILAKVFEKLPEGYKPDASQVLKMRWVLTWKINPDTQAKKAKARAVILGYLDPEYERRPTASPTVSRTSRQLFLQCCASNGFKVKKGDVSGAFLQGREFSRTVLCEPLAEICQHLGLPPGSVTRLTKAAYGLVEAPLEWYLTINEFLESLGFRRQLSDPCVWGLYSESGETIGYACGHVDDFLFAGREGDPRWQSIEDSIKNRFRWGEWEKDDFIQCGVRITSLPNGGFSLSQPEFLDQVEEIYIPKKRWTDKESAITADEKQQMRSVLGCLSWHGGQVALDLCASVGIMLSKVNSATVQDLIEVNKLLRRAKATKSQKLIIHPIPLEKMVVATWVDASFANRPDGSSTKGILVACSSTELLEGKITEASPVYWSSSKIGRVCRSSASAETRAAVDGEDMMYSIRFQLSEFLGYIPDVWQCDHVVSQVPGTLITDSKNVYDRVSQTMLTLKGAERRSDLETLCLKEAMSSVDVQVRWVNGDSQLANSLTKESEPHQCLLYLSRNCRWRIVFDPELLSGKRRKALGLSSLDTHSTETS